MNPRCSTLALLSILAFSPAARAEIFIHPPSPLSIDEVTIELTNQYTVEAFVETESIELEGNTFTISQRIRLICELDNAPILTSEFEVGELVAGDYEVIAEIELVELPPPPAGEPPAKGDCGGETLVQTASFTVADPTAVAIPTLGAAGLALIAGLLVVAGVRRIRRSHGSP